MMAKERFESTNEDDSGPYVDYHATVYTPASFALIIFELGQLGMLPFEVERSYPTTGCEFYVALRNRTPRLLSFDLQRVERLRLLKAMICEVSQQGRWLLDDP